MWVSIEHNGSPLVWGDASAAGGPLGVVPSCGSAERHGPACSLPTRLSPDGRLSSIPSATYRPSGAFVRLTTTASGPLRTTTHWIGRSGDGLISWWGT